jgi:hypothetical protein
MLYIKLTSLVGMTAADWFGGDKLLIWLPLGAIIAKP